MYLRNDTDASLCLEVKVQRLQVNMDQTKQLAIAWVPRLSRTCGAEALAAKRRFHDPPQAVEVEKKAKSLPTWTKCLFACLFVSAWVEAISSQKETKSSYLSTYMSFYFQMLCFFKNKTILKRFHIFYGKSFPSQTQATKSLKPTPDSLEGSFQVT